jgi:8-oxo-dGTP pyrophosphatase MutT (NUDIX family)
VTREARGDARNPAPGPAPESFAINLIEDAKNRLLLLRRGLETRWGPGLWGFSAGHIEAGESPEECSRREMREELGGDINVELVNRMGPVRDTLYGGRHDIWLFHYRYLGGDIRLNHEHTAFAWVAREDFRDYEAMDGTDEDILYLGIWPRHCLRGEKLPPGGSVSP